MAESLAEEAREMTPDGMRRLLSRTQYDGDPVRDDLLAYGATIWPIQDPFW
jgi:hypothetical protein